MGYTTDFNGTFKLNKPLDLDTHGFLVKLNETRRMLRDSAKLKAKTGIDYGIDGEFFVNGDGFAGQDDDDTVLDHNRPPRTQPGLWCQWRPNDNGTGIAWDGGEKFYNYIAWIEYIINKVLKPKGYELTGCVQWRGENFDDIGTILIKNNVMTIVNGEHMTLPKVKKTKTKTKTKTKAKTKKRVA